MLLDPAQVVSQRQHLPAQGHFLTWFRMVSKLYLQLSEQHIDHSRLARACLHRDKAPKQTSHGQSP